MTPRFDWLRVVVAVLVIGLSSSWPPTVGAADLKDARQALNDKKYPRAVEILDAYLAEQPRDHRALALRGRAHVELGAPEKALADLNRAIELQPSKNGEEFVTRGRAYMALREFDKARSDLSKAIELKPDAADRYFYRGDNYYYLNDPDAAFRDLSKAIELDPRYFIAYIARAHNQWHRGTKSQPVDIQQGENTFQVLRFESVVDRGLVDRALADLTKAVELAPDDPYGYQCRLNFFRDLRDWPRYVGDMKQWVRLAPQDPRAASELAWILATIDDDALRDGKTATELAETACELTKRDDPNALAALAAALAETRKFKRAVETLEMVIAKSGDVAPELKQLANICLEQYRRNKPLRLADPFSSLSDLPTSESANRLPGARMRKREAELTDVEQTLVRAINAARRAEGLKPLTIHPALVGVCRIHARKMVARGEVSDAFDGNSPGDRITAAGVPGGGQWGVTAGGGTSVDALVDEWKNSPIAKANILNVDVNQVGIGTAIDAQGKIYASAAYVEIK